MAQRGAVELAAVSKRFGDTVAVDAINLKIPAMSYCCLLGPSGCGKTTSLRMIAGHESVSDGDIIVDNHNISRLPPAKRGTAMMFQDYALFPHLNCIDNVAFSLKMSGVGKDERRQKAREQLQIVHMEQYAERLPAQLSGGQQQRVALARALITNPDVLLLDEPLSALDPFLRVRVREELKRLQAEAGITFIHVTHSQEEAMALADMIVVMNQGKIEQSGSARDIYNAPATRFVAQFIGGHNVIEGHVSPSQGDKDTVALSGAGEAQFRLPAAGLSNSKTKTIVFAVRSDKIKLAPSTTSLNGANKLPASVRMIEYRGASVQIALTSEAVQDFAVTLAEDEFFAAPFVTDERVVATWAVTDAHILSSE